MSAATSAVQKRPPPISVASAAGATASPKIPKSKLPVIQPPTYYGCEHIGLMFQEGPETSRSMKQFYSNATRVALDIERSTAQKCGKCNYMLRRTYLCLQCPTVHCPLDAKAHTQSAGHYFGVDSRTAHVYCFSCQDFIYDPTLEDIRFEQEMCHDGSARKKRRLEHPKPSPEDLKIIDTHTANPPCRAIGLRGILNMGSTCFMSVVLQSLIHNPFIRNFYLAEGHKQKDCSRTNCLSCAMDTVFSEFFSSDKTDGFGPVDLLTTSWKCEQTLAGYQQQDAHEYLQFLLNELHICNGSSGELKPEDCKCVIHTSFYGLLQSDVVCDTCKNVATRHDPMMDLSLDLKPKEKKRHGGQPVHPQTLQECLGRYTSVEKLVGDYKCKKCPGSKDATKQLTVNRLPLVLCIQLKRFEQSASGSAKIETNVRFPLQLDMAGYITSAKSRVHRSHSGERKRPHMYDLFSVVVHKGEMNSGHYTMFARHNGQWFMFDDSVITLASEKQVLQAQAYLLFYITRTIV